MSKLDTRLNAYRPDLANEALRGRVDASRFVKPAAMQVTAPVVAVRKNPRPDAMQLTQALLGENLNVFEVADGWAWAQLVDDNYVGYVDIADLLAGTQTPTHVVSVPASHVYPSPDLKRPPLNQTYLHSKVKVVSSAQGFTELASGGFMPTPHLKLPNEQSTDFVSIAEQFLGSPYLWGGKTYAGLDCSGLVQISLQASCIACPRDSDMQEQSLGQKIDFNQGELQRGDLVFWSGHVGIMMDGNALLHANGYAMCVTIEPIAAAVQRISQSGSEVTSVKRIS